MINASNSLYNYFNKNIREEGQEIEIKISKSGKTYTITDDDLVASSVKITKKSVSGASFDIGECYVDSTTFTINKNINNYKSLTGAKVTIRIKVNNTELNLSESVLLGTFRILQDGIKRTNTLLQVTADSYISKFDKSRKRATFTGDLYDLITDSCSKCKVTFGMSESAFRALSPNVAKTYEIKKDSSLKTHRDVIMYVAQLIGGFATTTPSGELIFKNYTSMNDICNVNDNVIVNYSIGDEVYNLSGLGMSVKENDVYLYREGEDDDSPYFLNLDSNPIIENCTDEEITEIVGNIWGKLIELNLNNFSFEFNGNPLIEVGDIISIPERSLETYVASCEWTYHGKEKISCVSVDKNKRIETQREKKNENKPNESSNDARVDDLIKNTTTETRRVKKTVTETLTIRNHSDLSHLINYTGYKNITIYTEGKQISTVLPSGETTTDNVSNVELFLIFYYPSLSLNISDIIDRIPSTTNDNDIITLNFKDIKGYIFLGYASKSPSYGFRIFNIKPYTGSKSYGIMNYDMTQVIENVNMSVNYFDSLSDSIFYETDAFGNLIDDIPNFNVSTSGRTVYTDLDEAINRTEDYGIDASFNFKFNNVLDANGINYESIENNILTIKYKDLKYIRDSLSGYLIDSNKGDTTEFYKNLITYSDTYYNRTKSQYIDSFDNTISEGGTLFSYCDIEQNVDTQNKYDNYTYKDYFDIDLTYKEEVAESYTTTIVGTSDKINDNTEKADKNENEIETLKIDVKKNKTNIDKLKQQVKSVTNKVGTMSNSLGSAKTDIAKLDIRVTNLENSGSSGGGMTDEQKQQLEQNTTDIRTLKTNVSNNTKNISTNKTNIDNLTTRVTNLEEGGSSGSGITEEERQQIQTNKTDIANNTKNISTNTTNITNLTTRVSNLENSGGSGSGITETERQQIQTNKTDIANLTTRVSNLENSGGSGSGITETERQQIHTNKTNIENLSILVSGHTTSIEDILRRLAILEQGGSGGETEETLKFTSFDIRFNKDKSNASYYFPSFDINNYKIGDTYYISETSSSQLYYYLVASLNKMNSTQTFRSRPSIDSSDFTIIDNKTQNVQSSDIQFVYANREFYYDCESSLNDLYAKSNSIHVKTYSWVNATKDTNWINETTGGKVTAGAHNGDIINLKTTITKGFKALNLANAPSELNKYYYKIIFSSSSTNHDNSNSIIVADWTPLNVEPGVLTDIRFTFNSAWGGKTVNLFISDGQYVKRADYDRIPLLT